MLLYLFVPIWRVNILMNMENFYRSVQNKDEELFIILRGKRLILISEETMVLRSWKQAKTF